MLNNTKRNLIVLTVNFKSIQITSRITNYKTPKKDDLKFTTFYKKNLNDYFTLSVVNLVPLHS